MSTNLSSLSMSTATKSYRYQLPHKAVKSDCPQCGPKFRKTFSRYIDTRTDELLPEEYGRCDRESNCGYHLSPYQKSASGLSYADEVYQQWKEEQSSSYNHSGRSYETRKVATNTTKTIPPRPIVNLPETLVESSLNRYETNQFAKLLERYYGHRVSRELLKRFQIGSSRLWNNAGACVFWLIDEQGRVRGGQIKLFDDTFHTVKYIDREGRKRTRTSWVHSALAYPYKNVGQSLPGWLNDYIDQGEFAPCLFGLPQLLTEPASKPIAIVEAPKTAVLCTSTFPQFVWLAVVGRSYLNAERLAPLKGRSIVLFPDLAPESKDYLYWQTKAEGLRQQGFQVIVSDYLERRATDEQRESGLDLADFILQTIRPLLKIVPDEVLLVDSDDDYPPDWDTPAPQIRVFAGPPAQPFPGAPLTFDVAEQAQRIQGIVIPPEEETPPVLVPSSRRADYARILGIAPDELPLYQLQSQSLNNQ